MMKMKVGGDAGPASDANRVLETIRRARDGDALRLDANQAWSMADALSFAKALTGVDGGIGKGGAVPGLEYIEEPLRDPRLVQEFWEKSGKVLPYALDESLGMGEEVFTDDVRLNFECGGGRGTGGGEFGGVSCTVDVSRSVCFFTRCLE